MKKVIKKYFILYLLCIFNNFSIFSQYIPNSSFENGGNPTAVGQVPHLAGNWHRFNSSDWYTSTSGFLNGHYDPSGNTNGADDTNPILNAHTGSKYIGFGPCEGARVKMFQKIGNRQTVTIELWFSPRTKKDTKINIYLSEKAKDEDENYIFYLNCSNPPIKPSKHFSFNVNSSGSDAVHIPGQWYNYRTTFYTTPGEDEYEWFIIVGNDNDGSWSAMDYVYVDDITVMTSCDLPCSPQLGTLSIGILQERMIARGYAEDLFVINVWNATGIEFTLWDRWGGIMHTITEEDDNGLKETNKAYYQFVWIGEDNNGNVFEEHVYNYDFKIWNCNDEKEYSGSVTYVVGDINFYQPPPIVNHVLDDCCETCKYIQNTEYTGNFRANALDCIIAGENVTTGTTGPVTVKNGANVIFYSENDIGLMPGFGVEAGAEFGCTYGACGSGSSGKKEENDKHHFITKEDKTNNTENTSQVIPNQTNFTLYPNPSDGNFELQINNYESGVNNAVIIYDLLGREVYQSQILSPQTEINLSSQRQGLYVVKVVLGEEAWWEKMVVR